MLDHLDLHLAVGPDLAGELAVDLRVAGSIERKAAAVEIHGKACRRGGDGTAHGPEPSR
jgi:hypothetical protein